MNSLFLYEEVLLLALHDEEGTFSNHFVEYAVAGAVLAELLLDERIFIADPKRKLVDHHDPDPVGDPIIDECQEMIVSASRRARLANWVSRLGRIPKLRQKVALQLCEREIIKADEDKVLFLFRRIVYPEINPEPEREIIARLEDAIFGEEKKLEPRTVTLVSLAYSVGLLKQNFGEKKIRARRKRIEKIVAGEATGGSDPGCRRGVRFRHFRGRCSAGSPHGNGQFLGFTVLSIAVLFLKT